MENPFFRNGRWYRQQPTRHPFSHSPSFGGVPVYQLDPDRETHRTGRPVHRPPERNQGAKVVQIPVHFVGSEKVDRSGSALKIQKVFRGFLVRKCMKKIKDIKFQVDEIEDKLLTREVMELVRRDEKERLRMNESLMSLLFKLDSICGVDFGVRGCRKAVIRKAIALQERIDAIVAVDLVGNGESGDDQEVESGRIVSEESDSSNQIVDPVKPKDSSENDGEIDNNNMEVEGNDGEVDIIDVGVDREVKVINCVEKDDNGKREKAKEGNEADDSKGNREMLERMMEDNEKMMSLMAQLFERNETQTRMINALTNRVEMLEKAFVCDGNLSKKKKKKKKKAAVACRDN